MIFQKKDQKLFTKNYFLNVRRIEMKMPCGWKELLGIFNEVIMCFIYINEESLYVNKIMEVEDENVGYDKRVM